MAGKGFLYSRARKADQNQTDIATQSASLGDGVVMSLLSSSYEDSVNLTTSTTLTTLKTYTIPANTLKPGVAVELKGNWRQDHAIDGTVFTGSLEVSGTNVLTVFNDSPEETVIVPFTIGIVGVENPGASVQLKGYGWASQQESGSINPIPVTFLTGSTFDTTKPIDVEVLGQLNVNDATVVVCESLIATKLSASA